MEEIKQFIQEFAKIEAETATLKRVPELDPYNNSVKKFYSFFINMFNESMGHMTLKELLRDKVYKRFQGVPADNPRHLFKISKYNSDKYGEVWIVYLSAQNPALENKILSTAYFIIREDSKLKIAKSYIYSAYSSDGAEYTWEDENGYKDLTFDNLNGPMDVVRYQTPKDIRDGLKFYNDNM